MTRLFGTDGIRGRAGTELTADLAFRVGRVSAGHFLERGARRVILARDTRVSGPMLASAFLSGVTSVGVGAIDLGIAPTPAVSVLIASGAAESAYGCVVSASHNPYHDNGIKLFSPDGGKLQVSEEEAIERRLHMAAELDAADHTVGRILPGADLLERYLAHLRERFPVRLARTALVVDAAHGAWAPHVRSVFSAVSDSVIFLNCDFTGTDINDNCGSTHLESLDRHLTPTAVGLAFDGDGDRMLIRTHPPLEKGGQGGVSQSKGAQGVVPGVTIDGDALLYLFAKHLVPSGPVVGTSMSNGALAAAMERLGRLFARAPVGDREVFERMEKEKSDIGGEQSGHIIFRSAALCGQRTGDGAVTALAFLKILSERYGESINALVRDLPAPFPQKLVNLRVGEKRPWESDPDLAGAVESARDKLGPHGRLVIRYSGTEPLLRLMAEAPSAQAVEEQLGFLTEQFRARLA